MYRIPKDFDISKAVGGCITQICVGEFDLQFTVGEIHFSIWSPASLVFDGEVVGKWQEGSWPDQQFIKILNVNLATYEIPNDRSIVLHFENGIELHLEDHSDQYESMHIGPWII